MERLKNPIVNQIWSLGDLAEKQVKRAFAGEKITSALPIQICFDIRRIVITGCGDSLAAALAMKGVFEKYCDVMSVDVYDPITFNRYKLASDIGIGEPNSPLLIGISAGGETARINEALQKANALGAYSLALTNKESSSCARTAKALLNPETPSFPNDFPGLRSYFASLTGLAAIACRLGLVRGVLSPEDPENWQNKITSYVTAVTRQLADIEQTILAAAEQWKTFTRFDFIGDDQALASAMFGQEKIYECVGETAYYDDSEEWCHINYFTKQPETVGTVVHAYSDQASFSRLKETIWSALQIGRPVLVITDKPEEIDPRAVIITLPAPDPEFVWLRAFADFIPSALLAGYIAQLGDKKYFNSFDMKSSSWDPSSVFLSQSSMTIKNSKIEYQL